MFIARQCLYCDINVQMGRKIGCSQALALVANQRLKRTRRPIMAIRSAESSPHRDPVGLEERKERVISVTRLNLFEVAS